ncbi:hypothetical protein ACFE04_019237 [Oxalis oulophora]
MGGFIEGSSSIISNSSSNMVVNPHPLSINHKIHPMSNKNIQDILTTIQPSGIPDLRRKEVISYVQKLFRDVFGIEVFPFGSVPLRTYLPDGDVDLTAICPPNLEAELAKHVTDLLKDQEKGSIARVRDVQRVPAQVQIVKCTVNDIPVDISFNQKSGLSALCFKEKVSEKIGKGQLYKYSVLLIKAWCFYEGRVLGAHQGLISTYAIEALVIYIINLFHASLSSPLAVLHRFLHYYSLFDWKNYCMSISGPVPISALPDIVVVEEIEEVLLSQKFLKKFKKSLSIPSKREDRTQDFQLKHINIVDPLKDNNNLGRSVSKGNFHRIIFAFSEGAKRLGEILKLKEERVTTEINKFFSNTLDRNGRGTRCDIQIPISAFGMQRSGPSDLSGDYARHLKNLQYSKSSKPISVKPFPPIGAIPNKLPPTFIPPKPLRPICVRPNPIPAFQNRGTSTNGRPFSPFPFPNSCPVSPYPFRNINSRNVFHGPPDRHRGFFLGSGDVLPNVRSIFLDPYVAPFNLDEGRKSRGTGTFIPDMTYGMYKDRMKQKNNQFRNPKDHPQFQMSKDHQQPSENPRDQHPYERPGYQPFGRPRDHHQQYGRLRNELSVRYPEFVQAGSLPQQGLLPRSLGFASTAYSHAPPLNFSPHSSSSPHGFSPHAVPGPSFLPTGFSPRALSTREFRPRNTLLPKLSQNTYSNENYVRKLPQNAYSGGDYVSNHAYLDKYLPKASDNDQDALTETRGKLNGDASMKSSGNNLEFTMEEFPLLPVCQKPLLENQSGTPKKKSTQLVEIQATSIAFGSYGSLPAALPVQCETELPNNDEKERSVDDSYPLIDDTEFPPLSRN